MKKLTTADSLITISHYRNILTSEGIPSFIRNEYLGEGQFAACWSCGESL